MEIYYSKQYKGRKWCKLYGTENRSGSYIPLAGWRSKGINSQYIKPSQDSINGVPFDEINNFSNSSIGELATKPNTQGLPKGCIYKIYGISKILDVFRPFSICKAQGISICDCNVLIDALRCEFEEIVARENGLSEPFKYVVEERSYELKIAQNYGKLPSVSYDSLTKDHENGFLMSATDKRFDPNEQNQLTNRKLIKGEQNDQDGAQQRSDDKEQDTKEKDVTKKPTDVTSQTINKINLKSFSTTT